MTFLPTEIGPLRGQHLHTSFSASLGASHVTGPEQNRSAWDCGYIASTLPLSIKYNNILSELTAGSQQQDFNWNRGKRQISFKTATSDPCLYIVFLRLSFCKEDMHASHTYIACHFFTISRYLSGSLVVMKFSIYETLNDVQISNTGGTTTSAVLSQCPKLHDRHKFCMSWEKGRFHLGSLLWVLRNRTVVQCCSVVQLPIQN